MKLSIITINYNDAVGLQKTLTSVASQINLQDGDLEHIIVDGGSTDGSTDVIEAYTASAAYSEHWVWNPDKGIYTAVHSDEGADRSERNEDKTMGIRVKWVSEPDSGIYNAMNKGIRMVSGDYCEFLNAGDFLAAPDVVSRMLHTLDTIHQTSGNYPDILYGNMQKVMPDGQKLHDSCHATNDVTLNMFYRGCLNHSPAYIHRSLFDKYGLYDESLRICSDWKFYMQSIVLGEASVRYVDILVTVFDMGGISETRKDILEEERTRLLKELVPQGILKDYEKYHFPMLQYDRLKRHHLWGLVSFMERVLFKLEKWGILR